MRCAAALALALAAAFPALGCDLPQDDPGVARLIVLRVKHLPEVETWAEERTRAGEPVQYLLALDQPVRRDGRCWLPVETRADGKLWKRFLVTPDRERVLEDKTPY